MKKRTITNKTILLTAVAGSLLIIMLVSFFSLRTSRQMFDATDEAISAVSSFYLETMAHQRASTFESQLDSRFVQMERALAYIREQEIRSQEELREVIGRLKALLSLDRFALADEKDVVYTQYTTYTGRTRHPFLSSGHMEDRLISAVSLYDTSKKLCLAIPTPGLTVMGRPFKACFMYIDMEDIVDFLAPDDLSGTYFAVYTRNGANLSGTKLGPVIAERNFFEAAEDLVPKEVREESAENFAEGAGGTMTFSSDGIKETLCYVPIQGTGWEFAVSIRESVIMDQIRAMSETSLASGRTQIWFTLGTALLFTAVLVLELRSLARRKLKEEQETSRSFHNMANTDSLTGAGNKHAYGEREAVLNQQIREDPDRKLALAVCDINGLKYVNDTQGHAAGDRLIRKACAMLRECFPDGEVFRVGGDEFAVLFEGEACDALEENIRRLDRKDEENIRKNDVVVSAGYAVLEEGDRQLRDVFERADRRMYERKKELKAMGARTRDL